MAAYTFAAMLSAEGGRVGIITCLWCGAALLLDERDSEDPKELHDRWHRELD